MDRVSITRCLYRRRCGIAQGELRAQISLRSGEVAGTLRPVQRFNQGAVVYVGAPLDMGEKGGTVGEKRALFEREALPHVDALYSAALRLSRNPDDARDLLQETVLRAYRFFHQYTPGTNCRAWLLTILYNNFRNGYRGGAREMLAATPEDFEREVEGASVRSDKPSNNPEALLAEQVLDHEVAAALDALPADFRSVLMLIDVQELNYQEAAQVLGCPIGTVKSRVSRGRQMMRSALAGLARKRGIVR